MKKKKSYNEFSRVVGLELITNGVCCIDSVSEISLHPTSEVKKVECSLFMQSMSEEAKSFMKMVMDAPTEMLDSLFKTGAKTQNRTNYNRKKIYGWLRKHHSIKKARYILSELKNLYEYML